MIMVNSTMILVEYGENRVQYRDFEYGNTVQGDFEIYYYGEGRLFERYRNCRGVEKVEDFTELT